MPEDNVPETLTTEAIQAMIDAQVGARLEEQRTLYEERIAEIQSSQAPVTTPATPVVTTGESYMSFSDGLTDIMEDLFDEDGEFHGMPREYQKKVKQELQAAVKDSDDPLALLATIKGQKYHQKVALAVTNELVKGVNGVRWTPEAWKIGSDEPGKTAAPVVDEDRVVAQSAYTDIASNIGVVSTGVDVRDIFTPSEIKRAEKRIMAGSPLRNR